MLFAFGKGPTAVTVGVLEDLGQLWFILLVTEGHMLPARQVALRWSVSYVLVIPLVRPPGCALGCFVS